MLKYAPNARSKRPTHPVSVLFNEPKLLKSCYSGLYRCGDFVSVLFNEPKLLKSNITKTPAARVAVSVLFNEPKLLKSVISYGGGVQSTARFSALQRAEIAEIELKHKHILIRRFGFSALQRAEIAEIATAAPYTAALRRVSVLFNEPKLLKLSDPSLARLLTSTFQCSSTSRNC